ncbi:hypothetical protein TSUD_89820 [Trifolium subterraneum]|uniref:Uncharacterized protein n=1 Tax=Trifolium subterraneum TaxID=3900 RepID=A0A2Z6NBW7_TRISU|nr:hypothetical protein TSUD_89820 [Trifolium subterraneum]
MQWIKQYCDSVNSGQHTYDPLERREVCKGGGREVSKKSVHSQPSNKGSSTSHRAPPSHVARRNDVSTANPSNQVAEKATRPPAAAVSPAYDQQWSLALCLCKIEWLEPYAPQAGSRSPMLFRMTQIFFGGSLFVLVSNPLLKRLDCISISLSGRLRQKS